MKLCNYLKIKNIIRLKKLQFYIMSSRDKGMRQSGALKSLPTVILDCTCCHPLPIINKENIKLTEAKMALHM